MSELFPSIAQCAIVATALKVLLFPAYKSTDFEVHRNWLALTHSLPVKEWYYEKTSEWTLDYPPFFAYFEWLLSQAAAFIDLGMLQVKALEYDSWRTIYFQRATVILTELVLVYALHFYVKTSRSKITSHAAALSILLSPGLLIIDHIHFQYNGFMYGMLILSMVLARKSSTLLLSGVIFAILLCFKHIYMYIAPAYFVYLLRAYCLGERSAFPYFNIRVFNCAKLGVGIVAVFAGAFGPFALWGQLDQVFRRLFPFSRGLCHAYWAPNVWAMYSFSDRLLIYLAPRLGLEVDREAVNSVTRGLVGDTSFAVLPDIVPLTCFLLTLAAQIPVLLRLLYKPTWETFVGAVTLCGYASFLFGWHVHEKAILLVIIPFSLIALHDRRYFGAFRPLAVAGHVSLFPLLFTAAEFPVKTVYTIFWLVLFLIVFDRLVPASPKPRIFLLDRFSLIYIALSIPLIAYCSLVHAIVFGSRYEFIPLMFTSSYSAIGVVLYKRKPVKLLPEPKGLDDNAEVWVMGETGEVFTDYEEYLNRRDFYLQASTPLRPLTMTESRSNITAKESEVGSTPIPHNQDEEVTEEQTEAVKEINEIFPKPLRKPVLRFVQFRTETRMDDLVNAVFDHFKEEYFQDEMVTIEDGNNARRHGIITGFTDNNQLNAMYHGQMLTNAGYSGYIITMDDTKETVVKHKAAELQRERKSYSKLILKQYLRASIKRESWIGAPWMVKSSLAKVYEISTKVPDHKTQAAVAAQRQAMINHANGTSPQVPPHNQQHAPNGHPHQNGHQGPLPSPSQIQPGFHNFVANGQHGYAQQQGHGQPHIQYSGPPPYLQHRAPINHIWNGGPPPYLVHSTPPPYLFNSHPPPQIGGPLPPHLVHILGMQQPGSGLPLNVGYQTSFPHQPPQPNHQAPGPQQVQQQPQPPRPFVPAIKYPCEDLDIKDVGRTGIRPTLKYFSDDGPDGYQRADDKRTGILMKSVGPLLGAWETLNVHDTIYMLDSFTYDDFVDAMAFSSEEAECELFVEVHCSILKQIVNESGKIQAALPKMAEAEEESEDENSSQESSPEPEPEPPARTTRSSLRKSEAQQIVVKTRTPTPEPPKDLHNAAEFVTDFDWVDLCKVRNFRDGNWQAIVVALLYRLSFDPVLKESCDEVLAQLVPADQENTIDTIAANYNDLDVNLRVSALDIMLRMTVTTEAFRDQLVAAAQEMTRLRKEKIDYQRKRKEIEADIARMELDRKILLPENTPASPSDTKENDAMDVSMTSVADDSMTEKKEDADAETDAQIKGKTRPVNKNKRKAAAEEARKEKAKKAKAAAELSKKQKEWEKLLADIQKKRSELAECEANIFELDDDLRETLVHRSKVLGKDRFLNKYYWFEHNGMPFGGVPNSSTAEYGYANGRIWVQGPDKYEMQPNLEEPGLSQDKQRLGFTIPERKAKDEGDTHLSSSTEWAYYDDPADIEALYSWLDDRGLRERGLKKELAMYKDPILKYMAKMREHLYPTSNNEPKDENDMSDTDDKPRISTRNRTSSSFANKDKDNDTPRCLRWTNSIMREEYGHVHHDEYEPPRKAKAKATTKSSKAKGRR
ncbi:glycosyltransferase family 57 protein [Plenodomus tracheiphilus IPT5]|uniref:Glycosyltransferase family 57 protein n=1 Tax=Plenodomus tracheiphilus IPT5 TaxID=1408161 RepID=A0A6A7BCY0_9PLEO|nr:glycosyltransferase family 57 protein [Plenodomus tracheiphilus IPT5]